MGGKRKTRSRAQVRGHSQFSPLSRVLSDDEDIREILSSREESPAKYSRSENERNHFETVIPVSHTEPEKSPVTMIGSPLTYQKLAPFTGDKPVTCKSILTPASLTNAVQVTSTHTVPQISTHTVQLHAPTQLHFSHETSGVHTLPRANQALQTNCVPYFPHPQNTTYIPVPQLPVHSSSGGSIMSPLPSSVSFVTSPSNHFPMTYTGHFISVPSSASFLPATNSGYTPVISSTGALPVTSSMGHLPVYSSTGPVHLPVQTASSFLGPSTVHPSETVVDDRSRSRFGERQQSEPQTTDIAEMIQTEVRRALLALLGDKQINSAHGARNMTTDGTDSSDDSEVSTKASEPPYRHKLQNVKIPPFDGKEDRKIWFARFEEIAERRRYKNKY